MEKMFKAVFCYEDGDQGYDESLNGLFSAKFGELLKIPGKECHTIYAGLGKHEEVNKDKVKCLAGKIAKELKSVKAKAVTIEIGHLANTFGKSILMPVIEGIALGGYEFNEFKKEKGQGEITCTVAENDKEYTDMISTAKNIADGVNLARDLVNTPPKYMTPVLMAERIEKLFQGTAAEVSVLDEKQCESLGMGSFLSVGLSSGNMPRFVIIRYLAGEAGSDVLGYVGKGVTFDTGGYSLKTNMVNMKTDMAGAAAVTGALYALVKNRVKTNVIGVLPLCENRVSNDSFLPDDVLTAMNGKTIEIVSTDAEGRLILADALTYAVREEKVTKLVDIATLTGSMVRTLGGHRAGFFTNNEQFSGDFKNAAEKCGERYWQFPMDDIYRKQLKSNVADMKNSGGPLAGAIFAACFLEEFVEKTPWIHMDIAGTAFKETPVFEYQVKGATGFGAETLYALALS